jgi:hypothetical protein
MIKSRQQPATALRIMILNAMPKASIVHVTDSALRIGKPLPLGWMPLNA